MEMADVLPNILTSILTQFSKGEYNLANNVEDDLVVITNNSIPKRPDDHTNALDTATSLTRI